MYLQRVSALLYNQAAGRYDSIMTQGATQPGNKCVTFWAGDEAQNTEGEMISIGSYVQKDGGFRPRVVPATARQRARKAQSISQNMRVRINYVANGARNCGGIEGQGAGNLARMSSCRSLSQCDEHGARARID
ncbi:Hypothetical protein SMAX5B_017276 [Scophthalmus maximus]|uniref:Uncharacterized protein n=1 Tax=Scophthalmus maximus TaxID=52904 RepID=A0A2U9CPW4_SCOMX|nr:Hypothetical protein SMAX5B_017276 [Scophthalmus maximus]